VTSRRDLSLDPGAQLGVLTHGRTVARRASRGP
jgi:hypothetical protein